MKYPIPCTNNLFIDDQYRLLNEADEVVEVSEKTENGDKKVEITIQGTKQYIEILWLYLYARHQFPSFINIKDILFYEIPDFRDGFRWRAKFRRPYWYDREHRIVPMCPNLAVSKNGHIIDTLTGTERRPWKEEYLIFNGYRPTHNRNRHMRVHILVANAWVAKHQDSSHPYCNHKNGKKYDPRACNLEWTSQHENMRHAFKHGLCATTSCTLRDVTTGKIHKFQSIHDVARFLKRSPSRLYYRTFSLNTLFRNKYELRVSGDERPWFYPSDALIENVNNAAKDVYKITEPDGTVRIFNGTQAFMAHYKLVNTKFSISLSLALELFHKKFPLYQLEHISVYESKDIEVLNEKSGEITTYHSVKEVRNATNLSAYQISYSLETDGRNSYNGYRVRYVSDKPWTILTNRYRPWRLKAIDSITGAVSIYRSMNKATKALHLSRSVIARKLRTKHPDDRYVIRRIQEDRSTTSRKT